MEQPQPCRYHQEADIAILPQLLPHPINNRDDVKYGFNINVYSSMLFIIPAIYSYFILPFSLDMIVACIICLITSVLNHSHYAKHKILNLIDIVSVNSIAAYYTLFNIYNIGFSFYANIMYIFAGSALTFYFYLQKNPHLYEQYHYIVHLLAITGIMFCIKSLQEYKNKKK
jgi:hypothetical protein